MKHIAMILIMLMISVNSISQCFNADFENGNFSGWEGMYGTCCPINLPNIGIVSGRHTIMSGTGTDPFTCGNVPVVSPDGGNFSARLGNSNAGSQAEGLSYTFTVTPESSLFTYQYAVVFEDPGHDPDEQPNFQTRVILENGDTIPCTEYTVTADSDLPGFQTCMIGNTPVVYRNWSTVGVDLSAYIGTSVTLEFTVGDCDLGAHFGYAYLHALSCSPSEIDVIYCVEDNEAVLTAPFGFASYEWSNGQTGQTITVDPDLAPQISCTLTSYSGCIATLTSNLLPADPQPSFNYIGECQGDIIQFENTSTSVHSEISEYIWDFGDGTASSEEHPNHTYYYPGIYNVSLTVVTDQGCVDVYETEISILPYPVLSFQASDVCLGEDVLFINTSFIMSPYTIEPPMWDFGDGSFSSEINPIHTYGSPGTYNVTLESNSSGSSCFSSFSTQVTIFPNPLVTSTDDITVCEGTYVTLSGSGAQTYTWSNGISNGIPFYSTQSQIYTVTGEDQNGCVDIATVSVTVNSLPEIEGGSDQTVCLGESIVLEASGGSFYNWDPNIQNGVEFFPSETGLYEVTGTDENGCSNSDVVLVIVNPTPEVSAGPDLHVCEGESIILFGSGALSYEWNNGIIDGVPFYPLPPYSYVVTGTDENGCQDTDLVNVIFHNLPNVTSTNDTICQGEIGYLSASGAIEYSWSPDIFLNSSQTQTVQSSSPSSIQYTVTGTDQWGCENQSLSTLIVNPLPNIETQNVEVCNGDSVLLEANGAITYFWSPGNSLNSSTGNSVYAYPSETTIYTITGINQFGCVGVGNTEVVVLESPDGNIGINTESGCPPLTVDFEFETTSQISYWEWDFGDGESSNLEGPSHTYANSGSYNVTLEVGIDNNCFNTFFGVNPVTVFEEPLSLFFPDPEIVSQNNPEVTFINGSIDAVSYHWIFGDGSESYEFEPNYSYTIPGEYIIELIVQNEWGCEDISFGEVTVNPVFAFYVPNSFTPNGDGINDFFSGIGVNYKEVTMKIFNRWGEKFFDETGTQPPLWDGSYRNGEYYVQIDVYIYVIYVTDIFGNTHQMSGHVSLIR